MKKRNLAFIDLETTGLNPDRHEIIELGCVICKQTPVSGRGPKLDIIEELEYKIKPEHIETAEPEALRVNGYNSGDWLFAADLSQALKALTEKADGAIMVAQNVTFDWPFLHRAFQKTGVPNRMHGIRLDIMSMALAHLYHKEEVQRFNLGALSQHFGIKNENYHTALNDAKVACEIFQKLVEIGAPVLA